MKQSDILTYNVELVFEREETKQYWLELLEQSRRAFNRCAEILIKDHVKLSLKEVHGAVYDILRKEYPYLSAQAVVKTYKDAAAALKTIIKNGHKLTTVEKKHLSLRIDKRLYSRLDINGIVLSCETQGRRTLVKFNLYEKVRNAFETLIPRDPLVFARNGRVYLSVSFTAPIRPLTGDTCVGVDLGMRRFITTSDGLVINDKEYLARKRKVRYLKRSLKAKGTKSAKRHLKKIRHKERNMSKARTEQYANELLGSTSADIIVLEDLTGIKKNTKKHKGTKIKRKAHNRAIGQVPFYEFKRILSYKAQLVGKRVETVCPKDTSKTNSLTGKKDGIRKGRRYYTKDGKVLDSDWNAAVNIAQRSKHPFSKKTPKDGGLTFLNGRAQSTAQTSQLCGLSRQATWQATKSLA